MPIHEYQCEKCGHKCEEVTLKMEEVNPELKCPKCKEGIAKRLMSCGCFIIHGYSAANGYDTVMR